MEFKVYYDTPNSRPAKQFDDRAAAIDWARRNQHKNTRVVRVEEVTTWDAQTDGE